MVDVTNDLEQYIAFVLHRITNGIVLVVPSTAYQGVERIGGILVFQVLGGPRGGTGVVFYAQKFVAVGRVSVLEAVHAVAGGAVAEHGL